MTQHCLIGFLMLVAASVMEVSARPNEPTTPVEFMTEVPSDKERSLAYDETNTENVDIAKEILEKIKTINEGLKKPNRRQQTKWNIQPQTGGGYIIDKEILEKLQQVIASGKLHSNANTVKEIDIDDEYDADLNDVRYSKQMSQFPGKQAMDFMNMPRKQQYINEVHEGLNDVRYSRQMSPLSGNQPMGMMAMPYMMTMPVLVVLAHNMFGGYPNMNSMGFGKYQTREGPTSPFDFQWPFASLFPILIRDPLLSIMNGGGWNNFIEYGQSADVCNKKQKIKSNQVNIEPVTYDENEIEKSANFLFRPHNELKSRQKRAVKKRTVAQESPSQTIQSPKKIQKFFKQTTTTTPKSVPDTKTTNDNEGDLRFPFGDFTWFGNKKPVAPSPGFFINRLKVRRGGVAIAGPGGVATAGRGGTAIVGPGGLAYTQPGGLAVAGPAARVVALSPNADLTAIVSRLQEQSAIDGSVPQLLQAIPEGKIVATGPIIYYHPNEFAVQYIPFYGGGKGQYLEIKKDNTGRIMSEKIVSEDNISSENVLKNSNENLISKVLAANLQNLRSLSTNLLKLHNLGRKTGSLGYTEKARFKSQLASLGEAASNVIKLIDELDDVDMLFKKNATLRKYDDSDDYVEDEGIGVDAPSDDDDSILGGGTIAEAKPFGLAVIGENGLAASRPMATAVAVSGVAVARPIATAVAGLDPTLLGINFQVNQAYSRRTKY